MTNQKPMIKLFRRIRQKLLSENKFSKYVLYAIGEIVLVVIGILIALQINNNNELFKQKKEEEKLLLGVKEDFLRNRGLLLYANRVNRKAMANTSKLINAITTKDKSIPVDSIYHYIEYGAFMVDPAVLKTQSYEAIIGSGKTSLIENQDLLNILVNFMSLYKGGLEAQKRMESLIDNLYTSSKDFYSVLGHIHSPETFELVKTYTPEEQEKALEDLYENKHFLSLLISKLRSDRARYIRQGDLIVSINDILMEFGYDKLTPQAELQKKYVGEYKDINGIVKVRVSYEKLRYGGFWLHFSTPSMKETRGLIHSLEDKQSLTQLNDNLFQPRFLLSMLKFIEDENNIKLEYSNLLGEKEELFKVKEE
jgi:hypothetical protein